MPHGWSPQKMIAPQFHCALKYGVNYVYHIDTFVSRLVGIVLSRELPVQGHTLEGELLTADGASSMNAPSLFRQETLRFAVI